MQELVVPTVPRQWADASPEDSPITPRAPTNGGVANFLVTQKAASSRSGSPNPRTSIKWQKRNVIINIPYETPFGMPLEEGGRPMPLEEAEVEERLRAWREQGYDVEKIGEDHQKIPVFPEEVRGKKVDASEIIVSIPDRRDWEEYVTALREEKLRALGVLLDDDIPAKSPPTGPRNHTPQIHSQLQSPALDHVNPFSPSPQSLSAMSNPHGPYNSFSPVSIPANGTPGPPGMPSPGAGQNYFHLPRQSISIPGSPHLHEWDSYGMFTPPGGQPRPTPPALGGNGVWSPPYGNGMRNGSPMGMGHHGHSASQYNAGYPMEQHQMDQYQPHHGIVGQDRYHQQQIRRGSPLAHATSHSIYHVPESIIPREGPTIDAPIPKHRHQLSVKLQKDYENAAEYQQRMYGGQEKVDETGYATNPVSPAPVSYPEQPEMPMDDEAANLGPELASNPDDDVTEEQERERNIREATEQQENLAFNQGSYVPEIQASESAYMGSYPGAHSREQSLQHRQQDFDAVDPINHSAMSMLMAGNGLGGNNSLQTDMHDDVLSEDARTNISDILTNPSEPPSPKRKFSTVAGHSHADSIASNTAGWSSEKPVASVVSPPPKPKFNINAPEFKFDPSKSFLAAKVATAKPFTPAAAPFTPAAAKPSAEHAEEETAASSEQGFGTFGTNFNVSAATFRPSLATTGALDSYFKQGADAFSPSAPEFKPSFAKSPPSRPTADSIFRDIAEPEAAVPGRRDQEAENAGEGREVVEPGVRKRMKQSPVMKAADDVDDVAFEAVELSAPEKELVPEAKSVVEPEPETAAMLEAPTSELADQTDGSYPVEELELSKSEVEDFANARPMGDEAPLVHSGTSERGLSPESQAGDHLEDTPEGSNAPSTPTSPVLPIEPTQKFNFDADAPTFNYRPAADDFNFEFQKPATPPKKVLGGMSESRYAHTPSPPPSQPAPPPPVPPLSHRSPFMRPQDSSPYEDDFGESVLAPMPTDAELDEVIKYMDAADPIYLQDTQVGRPAKPEGISPLNSNPGTSLRALPPWKRETLAKRMPLPDFTESTPSKTHQGLRSAGPSPSPRRVEKQELVEDSSEDSISEDEPELPTHAIEGEFALHPEEIGIAKDADSDWDDMLSEGGVQKLRPQSKMFFDSHVEELVGALFQRRLEPVLRTLNEINDNLASPSFQQSKSLADIDDSDADDEEEHSVVPMQDPRDRKLDKMKSALSEVLLLHTPLDISNASIQEITDGIIANTTAEIGQLSDMLVSEADLRELKDAILDNTSTEFGELKSSLGAAASAREVSMLRAALDALASKMVQREQLVEVRNSIVNALSQDDLEAHMADTVIALGDIGNVVQEGADTNKEATGYIVGAIRDLTVRSVGISDVRGITTAIQESLTRTAHKEDLIPIHTVLAEVYAKTAKTEELEDVNRTLVQVLDKVVGIDVQATHQQVMQLTHDNVALRNIVLDILRLAKDNSENVDFIQEANLDTVKENQEIIRHSLADIHRAIEEAVKNANTRTSKQDMRRNLSEQEQKETAVHIINAVAETKKTMQDSFAEMMALQPTIGQFSNVVDGLAARQIQVQEVREAVVEGVQDLPKLEEIKAAVGELVGGISQVEEFGKVVEESRVREVQEIRTVVEEVVNAQPSLEDFRALMEDVIANQRFTAAPTADTTAGKEELDRLREQVEVLSRSTAQSQKIADEELASKRQWEERAFELEAKLRLAEEELATQRGNAEEKERRLKSADEKRHQTLTSAQMRSALLEGAHSSLQKTVGELSSQNAALEGQVQEARESEERTRELNIQLESQNRDLRRAIETVRAEMEESIRIREGFRTKFDVVQEDMRRVSLEIKEEQQSFTRTRDEQTAKIQVLEAKLSAEITNNSGLAIELRRLQEEDKEAIRLRVELEAAEKAKNEAVESFDQLKFSSARLQERFVEISDELIEAKKANTVELNRLSQSTTDEVNRVAASLKEELASVTEALENAQEEVEKVRTDARAELEKVIKEANAETERLDAMIDEANSAKGRAVKEKHRQYEQQLEEIRSQHERSYRMTTEDAQREQFFLQERLKISQSEATHLKSHIESLQSQVKTLNENFKVANVAAQAAAQAATSAQEMRGPHLSDERALRESVDVLQNQLQQREARIEQLESELAAIDIPKLKETEGQRAMYRELLDLRIDDLEEIIHSCGLPHTDRGSLRDAATRLKATLEMQRHERERALGIPDDNAAAGAVSPAMSAYAAKLPGLATAAFQNWRNKGKGSGDSTPQGGSRPTSAASGFLNGILTPPNGGANALAQAQRFGARFGRGAEAPTPNSAPARVQRMPSRRGPPQMPGQLFRNANYDADADSSVLSEEFGGDESDATEIGGDMPDIQPFASPYGRR